MILNTMKIIHTRDIQNVFIVVYFTAKYKFFDLIASHLEYAFISYETSRQHVPVFTTVQQ